jgi:small-conductance mechanosensitive channel
MRKTDKPTVWIVLVLGLYAAATFVVPAVYDLLHQHLSDDEIWIAVVLFTVLVGIAVSVRATLISYLKGETRPKKADRVNSLTTWR